MSQIFLNPQMLFGIALVSVPIIIYLIHRQRYRRQRWAAMEFLLRALKRHQRRIQLQNLLLLLLRVAIIFFLVLAMARPVHRYGAFIVTPDINANWILAVDNSYSMGLEEDSRTLLDQARDSIGHMLDGVLKPGDKVALMTFGKEPRVLLFPTMLNEEGRTKLSREIEDLKLSTVGVDLGASFSALDELAGKYVTPLNEPEPKRIVVFSDFQRKDWLGAEGSSRSAGILQFIAKIQKEGGGFALAHMSSGRTPPNVAVTELSATPALMAKDVWVELRATVRNFGDEPLDNIDLVLQVDRDPEDASVEPQLGDVIQIPAGGSVSRVLPYKFTTAGYHTVMAEVRSDALVIDNRRYLSVRVEESVKILLVDGNPTANPLDRSTFHLEAALLPQDDSLGAVSGRITPFEPRYVPWNQLSDVDWKDYSAVILANVSELPPEQVDALKAYVRGGGALIVFLGPDVQPEFYNKFFREGKESLLPGNLEVVRGDPRYPVYLEIADENHPIARYFAEHREVTHMARPLIAFYRYYQVGGVGRVAGPGEATPGVRVFFRYNDTEKSPAMFDTGYGSGRVVWVTSTADQEWNDLSIWPDFVVFLYETISYAVRFGMSSSNLEVGEVFRKTYPSSQYASEVLCLTPDSAGGRSARSVPKAMRNLAGGNEFELTHEETQVPGIYRLDLLRPSIPDGNSVEYFTVNVNTEESQLKSMTDEDFQTHYPELQYKVFDVSQRVRVAEEEKNLLRGREYWKWILAVVLMLAVAETIAAYLFGRRNR